METVLNTQYSFLFYCPNMIIQISTQINTNIYLSGDCRRRLSDAFWIPEWPTRKYDVFPI